MNLADGSLHALTDRRGPDTESGRLSPDGKHIAYLGFDDHKLGYQCTQLYVMDADGTHSRSLTATLDRDAGEPQWSGDGKQIYFEYGDRGSIKLGAVDLSGKIRTLAADIGGGDVTRPYTGGSFSVARNGRFAYMQVSPLAPPSLAAGTRLRRQLDLDRAQREPARAAQPREGRGDRLRLVRRRSKDPGLDHQAAALRCRPNKYPLLLEIHGGPFANYGASFAAEMQLYAAAGYVVLYLNPRGSTGYGEEFANLIHHDYPDKDFDDLMSGVDTVIGKGYIDANRLFVTGGSGGGVLTAWIVGHTDRFRAAVVVKPVINWTSFVLTADMTNYFYRYWFGSLSVGRRAGVLEALAPRLRGEGAHAHDADDGRSRLPHPIRRGRAILPGAEAASSIDTALVRVPNASHDISSRPSLLIAKVSYVLAWFAAHDSGAEGAR